VRAGRRLRGAGPGRAGPGQARPRPPAALGAVRAPGAAPAAAALPSPGPGLWLRWAGAPRRGVGTGLTAAGEAGLKVSGIGGKRAVNVSVGRSSLAGRRGPVLGWRLFQEQTKMVCTLADGVDEKGKIICCAMVSSVIRIWFYFFK